jgi:metal-responsive CopG/Arc/MetJ family transcriptional regulator
MAKTRRNGAVERITVTIPPELKRLLDSAAGGRGMSRSEAAQAAIHEWVRRAQEGDLERAFGLTAVIREEADRVAGLAAEARNSADAAYEALRMSSSRVDGVPHKELARRARNRRRGEG